MDEQLNTGTIISIIILVWFTLAGWATQGGAALGRWLGAW